MRISRREFLKYCTIAAGALGLSTTDLLKIEESLAKVDGGAPHVVWIPGQACTGCTMSLANTITEREVDDLLLHDINLVYNEQLVAAAGDLAVASAVSAIGRPMVLAVEGAIPAAETGGNELFCTIWSRTGGIAAAGSNIPAFGGTLSVGKLVGSSPMVLSAGSIIAAGSELVAGTTLPAGTIVESAGDRAAMAALGASFTTQFASSYGSDRTNTNITLTAPFNFTTGTIAITGGTDGPGTPYPIQGSVLAAATTLSAGTIVTSSFDRLWLSEPISATNSNPKNTSAIATFTYLGTANDWALTNNVQITNTNGRAVAGPMIIAAGSTIGSGSQLKAGTAVSAPSTRNLLIVQTGIASLFGGYGSPTNNIFALTGQLSLGSNEEIFLTGKVTLPSTAGSIGGTPAADKTMYHETKLFGTSAVAILCIGTCSSFGGIPAAAGNRTGASGVLYKGLKPAGKYNGVLKEFANKTINISGCPPHSDWIVGTIAYILATNYQFPPLEAYARPAEYFGQYQCNAGPCEWRYNQGYKISDETSPYANPKGPLTSIGGGYGKPNMSFIDSAKLYKFKWAPSTETSTVGQRALGCLGALGCKGRKTKADCSLRRWNADQFRGYGSGWCVMSGAGCHGCTEPTFPDKVGKFFMFA